LLLSGQIASVRIGERPLTPATRLLTMSKDFQYILPLPEPAADIAADILETYQVTYEFRHEVQYREKFDDYCEWYYAAAQQHQKELACMRNDINLFGWFCRRRS
jgi:hypothetical protein